MQVCVELGGYVQQLNTHYGIYSALVRALEGEEQRRRAGAEALAAGATAGPGSGDGGAGGFTPEALLVGRMLRRDFER